MGGRARYRAPYEPHDGRITPDSCANYDDRLTTLARYEGLSADTLLKPLTT